MSTRDTGTVVGTQHNANLSNDKGISPVTRSIQLGLWEPVVKHQANKSLQEQEKEKVQVEALC